MAIWSRVPFTRAIGAMSTPLIQARPIPDNPKFAGQNSPINDGSNDSSAGGPPNGRGNMIAGGNAASIQPDTYEDYGMQSYGYFPAHGMVPEIAKANSRGLPSGQGHMALSQMMAPWFPVAPDQAPSRSQKSEGYTAPIQVFASSNTWQIAGQTSVGVRQSQPRTNKFVSPFSYAPIPTRMPWDL